MKAFTCSCNSRIFFENSRCLACGSELGWCPACRSLRALVPEDDHYRCSQAACGAALAKCANYAAEHVCNRCVPLDDHAAGRLCDYCCFNDTIPDLSVERNRESWLRLEVAKRRLLYSLDLLGLP